MKLSELGSAVENLSGVGPAAAKQFARLNIFTVADLLSVFPKSYDDRTKRLSLREFREGKVHTVCKVTAHSWFGYGNMKTLKICITDGTANASLVAFNRKFLEKSLPEGSIIAVTGSFDVKYNELQSTAFEAERLAYDGNLEDFAQTAVPGSGMLSVYPLTEGLSQKNYRKVVAQALKYVNHGIDDEIPFHLIAERGLLSKRDALIKIHCPASQKDVSDARKTLIYEELYLFEYKMALRAKAHRGTLPTATETAVFDTPAASDKKNVIQSAAPYFSVPGNTSDDFERTKAEFVKNLSPRQKKLFESLPFPLTLHQMKAITDMNRDIEQSQHEWNAVCNDRPFSDNPERQPFSMQRLLQGDVGSGKTLVSFFVALMTIDYGGQVAILAPTELLARQHAENAFNLLSPLGVSTAFLTGNLKAKGRDSLLAALRDGKIDLVVGTHALFSHNTLFKNLQLALIDEQHRFGVAQREAIIEKGRKEYGGYFHRSDFLMMSATPIPQTLALTAFGDLDVSVIRTMPGGRKPVRTFLTVMGHESNVYEAVRKELATGHQAYFVYPRIGGDDEEKSADERGDDKSLKAAEDMFTFLSRQVYPEFKCALVHSKIDEERQHAVLDDFRLNKVQVLVATTVVEVGVDVGNATCMVIEHADRFGLAELHQLRGRVGRSSLQSFCFLIYGKNLTEVGIARLKALHESNDGFVIAEEDLKIRGPGEVTGTAQSGYLQLNIADLVRDKEILKIARYDAFRELEG